MPDEAPVLGNPQSANSVSIWIRNDTSDSTLAKRKEWINIFRKRFKDLSNQQIPNTYFPAKLELRFHNEI